MTRRLPEPIREALASDVDEERVHALWTGTSAAVARRRYGRAPRAAWIASSVLAAAACVALAWSSHPPPAPAPVTTSLALADGSAPVAVDARDAPVRIVFADGSSVEAARGTRLAPVANDASQLALSLEAGRVDVHVTPGGPRRWRVECGPVVVEVIGTVFTVERTPELVRVSVERGVVSVRGAPVPDGERTLRAGDAIAVPLVSAVVAAEPPPVDPPATVLRAREPRRARPTPVDDADAWRALADRGDHDAAYEALHATGIVERSSDASARELLLLADVARLSGHPADAVLPLERLLEEHPDDAEAPLAAIILARIERDRGRAARAAEIYQRALALGVPSSLAATIHRERVGALRRAGDVPGCEDAVRAHLAAHPDDPRAIDVGTCSRER